MITLKKLKLSNFLSHQETEISFKENTKLSIEGISGSGKSSLVEAIIWVLYGKGRTESRNLIKRGMKFGSVVLELKDEKEEYRIERIITLPGKHTLDIREKKGKDFIPLKHVGLRDSQSWIEKELLKSSYTLFINSVAYPQDNVESFVKQNAIKRKELLMEIANTDNYDDLYERARDKINEIDLKLVASTSRIKALQETIEEKEKKQEQKEDFLRRFLKAEESLKDLQRRLVEAKEAEKYIAINKDQISGNLKEIKSIEEKISTLEKSIVSKQNSLKNFTKIDKVIADDTKRTLDEVTPAISRLKESQKLAYENNLKRQAVILNKPTQNDYSGPLSRLEGQLMDIVLGNDTYCEHIQKKCPRLEQELSNKSKFIEEQINDIKKSIQEQDAALVEYTKSLEAVPIMSFTEEDTNKLKELEEQEAKLSKILIMFEAQQGMEENIEIIKQEITDQELNIHLLKENINELNEVTKNLTKNIESIKYEDISDLEKEIDKVKSEITEINYVFKIIDETTEDIKKINEEIKKIKSDNKSKNDERECLNLIKEAFGSKGIKTIIIDYLLPRLEYRINDILSKMSDFKIQLETQKSKYDGEGMTEGLFINIFNEAGECFPLANYSGGQKLKITVAISEALATMQNSGFRIFDEIFVGLDESSIEGFNEVINSLQQRFSQIFCISHLRTIQDSFEEKIFVSKEGDTSKIN